MQRTKIGFTGGSVYRRAHNRNSARNFNSLSYENLYLHNGKTTHEKIKQVLPYIQGEKQCAGICR